MLAFVRALARRRRFRGFWQKIADPKSLCFWLPPFESIEARGAHGEGPTDRCRVGFFVPSGLLADALYLHRHRLARDAQRLKSVNILDTY
jgi:hypothetical protein